MGGAKFTGSRAGQGAAEGGTGRSGRPQEEEVTNEQATRSSDQRQSIEKFDKQLDNLLAEYERELEARKRGEPQERSLEEQNLQTVEQVKELLRGMRSGGEIGDIMGSIFKGSKADQGGDEEGTTERKDGPRVSCAGGSGGSGGGTDTRGEANAIGGEGEAIS